ncbi:hypothetical protein HOY82DRAFT_619524 [Tuber indicum]|nr:hypothetical protein HOY82DRAFT_619524 [Tuber indicum]
MGAVPKRLGKLELSGARGSGGIDGGSMKVMSKFITIKDPSGTGVMVVVKDKTTTFLKVKSYQVEKAKAARLPREAGY